MRKIIQVLEIFKKYFKVAETNFKVKGSIVYNILYQNTAFSYFLLSNMLFFFFKENKKTSKIVINDLLLFYFIFYLFLCRLCVILTETNEKMI